MVLPFKKSLRQPFARNYLKHGHSLSRGLAEITEE